MICILTHSGQLHIYNSTDANDVLNRAEEYKEVPEAICLKGQSPTVVPNSKCTFPGFVHDFGNTQKGELTILAELNSASEQ